MKKNIYFLIFTFFILSIGCENSSENDLIEQTQPTDDISYTVHIKPIINANCVSCHSNPAINGASSPMTNYNQTKNTFENTNALDRMNRQPGESGFMPLGGTRLPQASIDLVEQWINEGYLE
jgi:uncharacterized membrane protein